MPFLRRLAAALLLRRLSRDLARLSDAVESQNLLLQRLANHFAPPEPLQPPKAALQDTGVSFLDLGDADLALTYIERTHRQTGHVPDEDEILSYLADEKTTSLAQRLAEREIELDRLNERRRAES